MNNELEQKRLIFAVARAEKGLQIKPENLVVKARKNSGRKCQNAREEFSYLRKNAIVSIDNAILDANTKVTSKLLTKSVQRVIAQGAEKETTISA